MVILPAVLLGVASTLLTARILVLLVRLNARTAATLEGVRR